MQTHRISWYISLDSPRGKNLPVSSFCKMNDGFNDLGVFTKGSKTSSVIFYSQSEKCRNKNKCPGEIIKYFFLIIQKIFYVYTVKKVCKFHGKFWVYKLKLLILSRYINLLVKKHHQCKFFRKSVFFWLKI